MLLYDLAINSFYSSLGKSEEIAATYINSVYVRDADAALVCFAVESGTIYPVFYWRSEADDYDVFSAIKQTEKHDVTYLYLNADSTSKAGKTSNLLNSAFHSENLFPVIVDPFDPAQGAIIYQQLDKQGALNFSRLEGWPKMKEKIKRIRIAQPADVMALMQGLIKVRGMAW